MKRGETTAFSFLYPTRLRRSRGRVLVSFRDMPEALTEGDSRRDALAAAEDCLEEAVAGRIRRGDVVPPPSAPLTGEVIVALPTRMAFKAALVVALGRTGVTRARLAARLRCSEREVEQLLDPRHRSELSRLQRALSVLGKRLVVEMHAA